MLNRSNTNLRLALRRVVRLLYLYAFASTSKRRDEIVLVRKDAFALVRHLRYIERARVWHFQPMFDRQRGGIERIGCRNEAKRYSKIGVLQFRDSF